MCWFTSPGVSHTFLVMTRKPPRLPLLVRISFFLFRLFSNLSLRSDGTVRRWLLNFFKKYFTDVPASPQPRRGVKTADVAVDASRNLWFRLFVPVTEEADRRNRLPVLVFFHGGGFVFLSADNRQYDSVCRRFAREIPAVVVSVNYRLAPEHRYPSQYEDGFDVLRFLDGEDYVLPGYADLSRCFLAGDSAGGNIAHHVAKRWCEWPEFTRVKVIGLVTIQPFFGGKERSESETELQRVDVIISPERTHWLWRAFLPMGSQYDLEHEAINVFGPRAPDISKLDFPTTMVVIGGFDSLKDWQWMYYRWLKDSGKETYLIEYPDMCHAFYLFPQIDESTRLLGEIRKFVHDQCYRVRS